MKVLSQGNYFGETVKKIQTKNFGLSETAYPAQSKLPPHAHELPYLGYVLDGAYREKYERNYRICPNQSLIYHPAGERHEQFFETSAVKLFRVEIGGEYLNELARFDFSLEYLPGVRTREIAATVRRLHREFEFYDAISPLIIEGLILELIGLLARATSPPEQFIARPPRWLREVRELIEARFAEPLSLGEVAHAVDVHPVTVARYLRRYTSESFGEILRRKRIEFACREILKEEKPIAEIALSAGFYDQSHFTKIFKSLVGTTPKDFQSRRRKN